MPPDYRQCVKDRLKRLVKTGGAGKRNEQIMHANDPRTPKRLKLLDRQGQRPMRPGQGAKVAFVLEMTEKPDRTRILSDLMMPDDQPQHRYKEHEDNILENERLSKPAPHKDKHANDGDAEAAMVAPLGDSAPLDQIEESLTSSIELRAHPLSHNMFSSRQDNVDAYMEYHENYRAKDSSTHGKRTRTRDNRNSYLRP